MVLDLCIFLFWFRWDYFLPLESNNMDSRKQHFEVKNVLMMDLFSTNT